MNNEKNLKLSAIIDNADRRRTEQTVPPKATVDCINAAEHSISMADMKKQPISGAQNNTRKRRSLGRTHQIKTRLSDRELALFERRVDKSGLPQGEYLRRAILNNEIVIREHNVTDVAILDELAAISAELGRQGGLLKMIIRPNEGQRHLNPEEWQNLIETIRGFESVKRTIVEIKGCISSGNNKT